MKTDIEIASAAEMRPIEQIAREAGFLPEETEIFGFYKAKLNARAFERLKGRADGKLVLVTAVNPTPAGEGKTTTTVGLGDALSLLGKKTVITLREPSLGPVFGVKGGAAGGGYSQVLPMEDINLHFTGDLHAVTAANDLLCALADNHIFQGNELDIDPARVVFPRVLDMNDRVLRSVTLAAGGGKCGVERQDSFMITVASEVMAILCLASDLADLRARLGRIIVAYSRSGKPVTADDLHAAGAMAVLLRDALNPNLVQTIGGTPCLMHGGPFANIAHGCNSLRATRLALKSAEIAVTEAGFGADLGAEKFLDIKCRFGGLDPDAVVIVCSVRAMKYNGGVPKELLKQPDAAAVRRGLVNLQAHAENIAKFRLPAVVAVNRFESDTPEELEAIKQCCAELGVRCEESTVFADGGAGGVALAKAVLEAIDGKKGRYRPVYPLEATLREKIETVAREIYGAAGVEYGEGVTERLDELQSSGFGGLPVCIAKTQYSLSDDAAKLGRPSGFSLHVTGVRACAGAGFVVVYTGNVLTLPGLPKVPAANGIDIDSEGHITGLF